MSNTSSDAPSGTEFYVVQVNGPDRGRVLSGPHEAYKQARASVQANVRHSVSMGIVNREGASVGHHEDPDQPGRCEVCHAAYPCPGSVGSQPLVKQWPQPFGDTREDAEGPR